MSDKTDTPVNAHALYESNQCTGRAFEYMKDLERQLADSVSKADVAKAVWYPVREPGYKAFRYNGYAINRNLASLGITPDLLEGGAQ